MPLSQAKTLGGVGSILVLLSFIPTAGMLLGIAGFILVLIAIKYVSDEVKDRSIFNNMIIAVTLAIGGIITGGIVVAASVFRFIGLESMEGWFITYAPGTIPPGDIISLLATLALGLFIIWIFFVVSAIFLRRSYNSMASKLNVRLFRTTALMYLIGAATSILLVGFILILVSEIMQTIAFFSIPDQAPQQLQT
jgi:uncharacterized membrane protein